MCDANYKIILITAFKVIIIYCTKSLQLYKTTFKDTEMTIFELLAYTAMYSRSSSVIDPFPVFDYVNTNVV